MNPNQKPSSEIGNLIKKLLGNRSLLMGSYGEPDDLRPGGDPPDRLEGTHM